MPLSLHSTSSSSSSVIPLQTWRFILNSVLFCNIFYTFAYTEIKVRIAVNSLEQPSSSFACVLCYKSATNNILITTLHGTEGRPT